MRWSPLAGWDDSTDLRSDVYLLCIAMSLTFPCALLQVYQDVEDEDTLKAVEAAVRESTSVKRIEVTIERVGSKDIISLSSSPGCC